MHDPDEPLAEPLGEEEVPIPSPLPTPSALAASDAQVKACTLQVLGAGQWLLRIQFTAGPPLVQLVTTTTPDPLAQECIILTEVMEEQLPVLRERQRYIAEQLARTEAAPPTPPSITPSPPTAKTTRKTRGTPPAGGLPDVATPAPPATVPLPPPQCPSVSPEGAPAEPSRTPIPASDQLAQRTLF